MENIELISSYLLTILGLIFSTITFLIKFIKSLNSKKEALNLLKLTTNLMPLIIEAEKFIHYTKEEKKEYVMVKVIKLLQEEKININNEVISEEIDKLVSLTKQVNTTSSTNSKQLKELV